VELFALVLSFSSLFFFLLQFLALFLDFLLDTPEAEPSDRRRKAGDQN